MFFVGSRGVYSEIVAQGTILFCAVVCVCFCYLAACVYRKQLIMVQDDFNSIVSMFRTFQTWGHEPVSIEGL